MEAQVKAAVPEKKNSRTQILEPIPTPEPDPVTNPAKDEVSLAEEVGFAEDAGILDEEAQQEGIPDEEIQQEGILAEEIQQEGVHAKTTQQDGAMADEVHLPPTPQEWAEDAGVYADEYEANAEEQAGTLQEELAGEYVEEHELGEPVLGKETEGVYEEEQGVYAEEEGGQQGIEGELGFDEETETF